MKKTIYHGSENIIKVPIYGGGKRNNDYGFGFYCTESEEMACEWAVSIDHDGFANRYLIDTDGLNLLYLNREYGILTWLALLLKNRVFMTASPLAAEAKKYLIENFDIDISGVDIVVGYRADDSYFSFAQDFINGTISLTQLSEAMRLGKLGEQFVLISREAFGRIRFEGAERVHRSEWLAKRLDRDEAARKKYYDMDKMKYIRGDIYITKILDEEMKADDLRLQQNIS